MRIITLILVFAGLAYAGDGKKLANSVRLDGEKVKVYWSDGDSFAVRSGRHKNTKVRLMGYNTLESFGPVHSWGEWTGFELYKMQKEGTYFARSRVWNCKSSGERDHYKRLLVRCDDLVLAMVAEGFGDRGEEGDVGEGRAEGDCHEPAQQGGAGGREDGLQPGGGSADRDDAEGRAHGEVRDLSEGLRGRLLHGLCPLQTTLRQKPR